MKTPGTSLVGQDTYNFDTIAGRSLTPLELFCSREYQSVIRPIIETIRINDLERCLNEITTEYRTLHGLDPNASVPQSVLDSAETSYKPRPFLAVLQQAKTTAWEALSEDERAVYVAEIAKEAAEKKLSKKAKKEAHTSHALVNPTPAEYKA